jgi:hypothetical protein
MSARFCAVLPPYLLQHMAFKSPDARVRAMALQTLGLTENFRGQRSILSQVMPLEAEAIPGESKLTYDARGGQNLPGVLAWQEGGRATGQREVDEATEGAHRTYELLDHAFGWKSLNGRNMRMVSTARYGRNYCNPPDAPVWMADFSFRPLGEVREGDEVIGWQKIMGHRGAGISPRKVLCPATVLAVVRRRAQLVRVELESGRTLRCTPDHQWLVYRSSHRDPGPRGRNGTFRAAEAGENLVRVIDPTPRLMDRQKIWAAGYLAGIYDGEGTGERIAQYLDINPHIYARIKDVFRQLGLLCGGDFKSIWFRGDGDRGARKQSLVNFVNWGNPAKRDHYLTDAILGARWQIPDRVVSVRPDGEGDVVSMQTTSGNYVVWGYASKNCNAFWQGRQMVYGSGDNLVFNRFTAAIDVCGHELAHGVTQFTCGLEYQGQSGALNEHFSDVMGVMVDQWKNGHDVTQASWLIGKGLFTNRIKGEALRSMKAPGTAYADPNIGRDPQPDHMDRYYQGQADSGGVHVNSGIPNKAFYLAATALGGKAFQAGGAGMIWWLAHTQGGIQPWCMFEQYAQATVRKAQELGGNDSKMKDAVAQAWATVGVLR